MNKDSLLESLKRIQACLDDRGIARAQEMLCELIALTEGVVTEK